MIRYAITDPHHYGADLDKFCSSLESVLSTSHVTHLCFRDKITLDPSFLYPYVVSLCRHYGVVSLLNGDPHDAFEAKFDGVHIRSTHYHLIPQAKILGLECVASCHTQEDLKIVKTLGASMATLSPIWSSPNKGAPLGLERCNEMCDKIDLPIIALGGVVTQAQIESVAHSKAAGFASIRYFLTNGYNDEI